MIRAVIFDLDGTLYDYEACNVIAEDKLSLEAEKRLGMDSETFHRILKEAKEDVKDRLGNVAASHNRLLYMQRMCEMAGANPCIHGMALYNAYWDAMLDAMTPYHYVDTLFLWLKRAEIRIALLTDMTAHIQYRKIEKLKIGSDLDCIVTSEEAGVEKPDRGMFKRILEKVGLWPEEALMVGDSQKRDIDGAKAMGMDGILYDGQENFAEMVMTHIKERNQEDK